MSHEYHGTHASRSERKLSKLGPGIVTAARLEELLGQHIDPKVTDLLTLAEELGDMADDIVLIKHADGSVTAETWEGTGNHDKATKPLGGTR